MEDYMEFDLSVIFWVKVVTKNIVFGCLEPNFMHVRVNWWWWHWYLFMVQVPVLQSEEIISKIASEAGFDQQIWIFWYFSVL